MLFGIPGRVKRFVFLAARFPQVFTKVERIENALIHQHAAVSGAAAVTVERGGARIDFFSSAFPKNVPLNIKKMDAHKVLYKNTETLTHKNIDELRAGGGGGCSLIVVGGPFGGPRYSRSLIIHIVKCGVPKQFCIFLDDAERRGEKETIAEICEALECAGVNFLKAEYKGEKKQAYGYLLPRPAVFNAAPLAAGKRRRYKKCKLFLFLYAGPACGASNF
ncbi:MAG: hypothetical protein LBC53_01980 [Spirochaetaceae bacterium]|jgi:hypothetical protein|nr:hypothetical protein [Spirochaetaceae bacterium]